MKLRTILLFGLLIIVALAKWWCAMSEKFITIVSALGEWGIVAVIYWEWESTRFDHFLEDADPQSGRGHESKPQQGGPAKLDVGQDSKSSGGDRVDIYFAYCGLPDLPEKPRNQAFKDELDKPENEELRNTCHDHIRRMSRMGARLPYSSPLKDIALEWHVPVFLWEILGPYVDERREEAGSSYAAPFLEYALASSKRLLNERSRKSWTIRDPNLRRHNNVDLSRKYLCQMKRELKQKLKRRGLYRRICGWLAGEFYDA
jgi:hypothetical protein